MRFMNTPENTMSHRGSHAMFENAHSQAGAHCITIGHRRRGKRAWLMLAALSAWHVVPAQARAEPGRIELGAMVAPSLETHVGERRFSQNTYKQGWSAGAALRYWLSDAWSMQVELSHATRGTILEAQGEHFDGYDFRYLQLPLLARYGRIISNPAGGRPPLTAYVLLGPALGVVLGARNDEDQPLPRSAVRSFDVTATAGLGVSWAFSRRWMASLEARVDRGFADAFSSGVESKNQAFLLALSVGYMLNDSDGDGVSNPRDQCRTEAEDWNGYQDADGCPDADNDRDGITVGVDQCIEVAEDRDDFADLDGCPEPDNDDDGFLDEVDHCPVDAFPRMHGCPPRFPRARIENDRIVLDPLIQFDLNSATLTDEQKLALDQVAELLADYYPTMWLRVEGHADGEGQTQYNEALSAARSKAVADYLVTRGIDRGRLVEKGVGELQPIRREEAEAGKRRNRRVELVIIEK
jgi:outer membrane protein OmpA-like peptidoglycan-associated protein